MITGNESASPNGMWGQQLNTGLTIRQEFAARAMAALASNPEFQRSMKIPDDWDEYTERLTSGAVELADELIKQLNDTEPK